MIQGDLLLILLALPFAGSLLAAASPANVRHAEAWLSGAVAVAGLGIAARALSRRSPAAAWSAPDIEWLPTFGLDVSLRLDGFAWIFVVLIIGDRPSRRALRPLLSLAEGSGAALLLRACSPSWGR